MRAVKSLDGLSILRKELMITRSNGSNLFCEIVSDFGNIQINHNFIMIFLLNAKCGCNLQ